MIIESAGSTNEPLLPAKLLLEFAKNFKATEISPLSIASKPGYRLDLTPNDPNESLLSTAAIWVSEDDKIIHRLKLVDLNGNSTMFFLSDIVLNDPLLPSETEFKVPDSAEVFDMR